jgi:hypothetical protein
VIKSQDCEQFLFRDPALLCQSVMPSTQGDDVFYDVVASFAYFVDVVTI